MYKPKLYTSMQRKFCHVPIFFWEVDKFRVYLYVMYIDIDQNQIVPEIYGLHLLVPNVTKIWWVGLHIKAQRQTDMTTISAFMVCLRSFSGV